MQIKIEKAENIESSELQLLTDGLYEYAKVKKDHAPMEPFAFFLRDENGMIRGGCNGNIGYGWMYVDQIWIEESCRGKGYGTELMMLAEKLGKEKGCLSAGVNTMDWEAPEFYKKLGYRVEFERHGLAKNSVYFYLRKDY